MADSFASFARKLDRLQDAVTSDAARRRMATRVGVLSRGDAEAAVRADLGGDLMFSGWRRAPLKVGFDHKAPGEILFRPQPRARGPFAVAEFGRRAGMSKGRKHKGRVGATRAKNTWSDALRVIEREMPGRVQVEVVAGMARALR